MSALHPVMQQALAPFIPSSIDATTQGSLDRRARIAARRSEAAEKEDRISHALYTLRTDCTTETAAIRALHAISAGLMTTNPLASTDVLETVGWINELADQIQYRNEP